MKSIESLYLRNLFKDLKRNKVIVTLLLIAITLAFCTIGYRNTRKALNPSIKEKEEIEEYNSKISNYDEAILNIEESLKLAKNQVEELQNYVDKSIYMQIDSQNIHVVSAQYSILSEGNVENILASFVYFINEGGIIEDVSEEYPDLEAEYWRDIINCSTNKNVLNLTIYHYETDKAQKILDVIEKKLFEMFPKIQEIQGNFDFQKLNSTSYIKADINVTNTQNNNKNNLKSYSSNVADYDNKLISQKNAKADFIKKNEPEVIIKEKLDTKKEIVKYGILGMISGMVLILGYFMIKYIIGNRIKSEEDLVNTDLNIIGCYSYKSGYKPDLERCLVDLELWAKEYTISKFYLNALRESKIVIKVIDDLVKKIKDINLQVEYGYHTYENAEDLKRLVESKYCILLIETGKTTYSQIEQQINLCKKFHVIILGCILVEK